MISRGLESAVRDSGLLHALLGLGTRDDVLERPGGSTLAFEIKRSAAPRASRGLLTAMQDLGLQKAHVVCPVRERFTLAAGIEALPVEELPRALGAAKRRPK